jgi:hypothetical protein
VNQHLDRQKLSHRDPMADPGRSRRSIRVHWGANEEESRAYLQTRLTVLFRIMFLAYGLPLGGQYILWDLSGLAIQ